MAIAFVQSTQGSGTVTQLDLAFLSNNAAGNLIIVSARIGVNGRTITVTDSKGNTYTQDKFQTASAVDLAIYSAKNIAAGANTVTCSISGAADSIRLAIHEYSGLATASPLDQVASATATGTAADSGATPTTTVADELLFACCATGSGRDLTAGASFTEREVVVQGAATERLLTEDRIVSATGAYNGLVTLGTSGLWCCAIATYKGASVRRQTLMLLGLGA